MRARSALSGRTRTPPGRSRRQSRSFGSVIIFMQRHDAASLAAMKSTSGAAIRSGCSMPISVAMIAVAPARAVSAYFSIPPVGSVLGVLRPPTRGEIGPPGGGPAARRDVLHDRGRAAALGVNEEVGAGV